MFWAVLAMPVHQMSYTIFMYVRVAESIVVILGVRGAATGPVRACCMRSYVIDVPLITNFTNVCTSVYVCPGRV